VGAASGCLRGLAGSGDRGYIGPGVAARIVSPVARSNGAQAAQLLDCCNQPEPQKSARRGQLRPFFLGVQCRSPSSSVLGLLVISAFTFRGTPWYVQRSSTVPRSLSLLLRHCWTLHLPRAHTASSQPTTTYQSLPPSPDICSRRSLAALRLLRLTLRFLIRLVDDLRPLRSMTARLRRLIYTPRERMLLEKFGLTCLGRSLTTSV
jgi:hypothetical protein